MNSESMDFQLLNDIEYVLIYLVSLTVFVQLVVRMKVSKPLSREQYEGLTNAGP